MRITRHNDCGACGQPRIVMTLTDDEALLLKAALRRQNSVAVKIHDRLAALGIKAPAR